MQKRQPKERTTGSQHRPGLPRKRLGSWSLTSCPKYCLPHKYCVDKPCEPGILGQKLDIEKGLFFIGKQAKGLSLAFLRPAMQTATCQEEMPSVRQVQQLSEGHSGRFHLAWASFLLLCIWVYTQIWPRFHQSVLTVHRWHGLTYSQQWRNISEVCLTIPVWAKGFQQPKKKQRSLL